ncbi:DNA -binding domain-containing protein [Aurantiacibacter flavus]|uniref:DNA -binding domain-containing protein n=1 Tax=Aurantiacibacter flavus TaxID=3145232 RepID=UPI003D233E30
MLRFCFTGLERVGEPLTTLRRLAAFERLGRMPRHLFPAERRAERWTLALRAHDARTHGASQREVAEALFGVALARSEWDVASDHLRSRIRRLLRLGNGMIAGGWRTLLAPASTRAAQPRDREKKTVTLLVRGERSEVRLSAVRRGNPP